MCGCFFFKQKTAYEMRISDWSSDVCSSDLMQAAVTAITEGKGQLVIKICQLVKLMREGEPVKMSKRAGTFVTLAEVVEEVGKDEIGRASCRERVGQYV